MAKAIYDSIVGRKSVFEKLSELVLEAENFNSKCSNHDIIREYLHISGDCKEILLLVKDLSEADGANAVLLLKVLCNILIRIASDLQMYSFMGTTIAKEILSKGLKTIFLFMKFDQKPSRTKIAIHLLSSMVALGPQVASDVFAKLNFSSTLHGHLFQRHNLQDEEDVRTAFLNLIVLFITICGNDIIRHLMNIKGFLNGVFPGLVSDRASTIILVLSTYRTYIIENSVIPKTYKTRLFNDYTLRPVMKLFHWEGPRKPIKSRKRKLNAEPEFQIMDTSEEDKKTVKDLAYEFMLSLCTSHKNGIIFQDHTFGTSEKNHNHMITNILNVIPKPYTDLVSDFVVIVLKTCPDQMKFYLPLLKDSFTPRYSAAWVKMIHFYKKVTLSQDPVMCLFKSGDNKPLFKLLKIAEALIIPNVITKAEISKNFEVGHPLVCYYLLEYIACILRQVIEVVNFCNEKNNLNIVYSISELEEFRSSCISFVVQHFTAVGLQSCWNKLIESVQEENKDEQTNGFPAPALYDQLVKFLEVVCAFQHITPSFCQEFNIDLAEMCRQLKKCSNFLKPKELSTINVQIINLIAGDADQALLLWEKGTAKSPLLLTVDIYLATGDDLHVSGISHIIYKILLKTKIFRFCMWEIDVWLHALESTRQINLSLVMEGFSDAILMILQEPDQFSNALQRDSTFQELDILENLKGDDSKQGNVQEKHFSSLASTVLKCLSSTTDIKAKAFQTFTESALIIIMHHQYNLDEIFILIEEYKKYLSSKFYKYCQLLYLLKTTHEIDELKAEDFSLRKKPSLTNKLQYYFFILHTCKDVELVANVLNDLKCFKIESSINSFEKQIIAWQILHYIDIETALLLEKKIEITSISEYQNILHQLITSELMQAQELDADYISSVYEDMAFNKLCIVKDFLQHPIILKLFLVLTEHVPKKFKTLLHGCICTITQTVLNIANVLRDLKLSYSKKYFVSFKEKLISLFLNYGDLNLEEKQQLLSENQLPQLIDSFSSVFSAQDVILILECVLCNYDCLQYLDPLYSVTSSLLKVYVDKKEFVLLSRKAIQSLFSKYVNMKTKNKSTFRELICKLLQRHPIYALFVNSESTLPLIHSKKELHILDMLMSSNGEIKQFVQLTIVNEINSLKLEGPHFIFLLSRCASGNLCDAEIERLIKPVASTFWKVLTDALLHEISSDNQFLSDSDVGDLVALLFENNILSEHKMKKFFNKISTDIPSVCKMKIFLQLMIIWKQISSDSFYRSFKISLHWLVTIITEENPTENFQLHDLLKFITETLQDMNNFCDEELHNCHQQWTDSYKNILKVALRNELVGSDLLRFLQIYFEKMSMHVELPTQIIYDLITTHSNFFNIMLSGLKESVTLKEPVIDLLITIVNLNNKVCRKNHIPLFLGAYGATLSTIDQKLLCLIKLYEDNGIDMNDFSPFLWGKAAVLHYSVHNKNDHNLLRQPSSNDVLSLFRKDSIMLTALNIPLRMELKPSVENWEKEYAQNSVKWDQVYDVRFVLPLLANLISPGSFLQHKNFIASGVLTLIFASLSSFSPEIRSLGYYCLTQFYYHLEGARFIEREIWLTLLDSLRNSIAIPNPKIPSIVTLFLGKVVDVIHRSNNPMYTVLTKFIMVKAKLDIDQVPEFYTLFNSIEIEQRKQKNWILNLLAEGIRTSLDFHICEKRYIFTILLPHYYSSLSHQGEKIKILQIILATVRIKSSARTLCQTGLISWLHNVISYTDSEDTEILKNIINVLCVLWDTTQRNILDEVRIDTKNKYKEAEQLDKNSNEVKQVGMYSSFPYEFFLIQLKLSQKINHIENEAIMKYLQTFLNVLKCLKSDASSASSTCFSKLSFQTVSQFYELWKSIDKQTGNYMQNNLVNKNEEHCNVNLVFSQIIIFWEPLWNVGNTVCYEKQLTLFTNVVKLMLLNTLNSQCYSKDIAKWLYRCLNEDKTLGLFKRFSSVKNIECFELVCQHFENSLQCSRKWNVPNVNNVKYKVESSKWKKLLKYFRKTGENISHTDASPQFYKILNDLCE